MRLSSIETPSGRRWASSGVVSTPFRSAATEPPDCGVGDGVGAGVPALVAPVEGVTLVVGDGPTVGRMTAVGLQAASAAMRVMPNDRSWIILARWPCGGGAVIPKMYRSPQDRTS